MQKELSKYTFYLSQVSITLHIECQTMELMQWRTIKTPTFLFNSFDIWLIFQKQRVLTIECKIALESRASFDSCIIRYSWFCWPCMRCEMSIIRKMGLWISDVIFSCSTSMGSLSEMPVAVNYYCNPCLFSSISQDWLAMNNNPRKTIAIFKSLTNYASLLWLFNPLLAAEF